MGSRSRGIVLRKFGSPFELETFDVDEPGEMAALVNVEYAGICGTDVHLQDGRLPISTPLVLGHEAVGRIAALGPGLERDARGVEIRPGDAVSWLNNISCGRCRFCLVEQQPTLCTGSRRIYGINQPGGWADRIHLQAGTVMVKLPDGVEPRDVIPLGCAGPTAAHGVLDEVQVRQGDVVVVQGSGPVGVAAAIYAQMGGAAKVIMVGGPATRLKQADRLGIADVHIDVTDGSSGQDRVAAVRAETTDGLGADVVIECAGAPAAVAEGIDMCRPGAQYAVVGQYTDHGTTPINPHLITRKQLRVHGSWGFSARHYITYVTSLPRMLERFDLASLLSEYPLEAANEAVADVRAGAVMKAVLRPAA